MAKWLGIDIAESSVRLALLRSSYRRMSVEALREERLSDHESPSAAIRAALTGLKADTIAAALPGNRCFLRTVSLPKAAQRELASVLSFEVESTLPFEMDEAVMDHKLLTHVDGIDKADMLPILAGVAYNEEVRSRIDVVARGSGSEPQRVGVGPLPLANLAQVIPALARPEPIAILDLDDYHADVLVLRKGEPRFVRSISRGTVGLPETAAALSRELRRTTGAWRMQGGEPLAGMYVVGAGRHIEGLDHFLNQQLGVEVLDLPRPTMEGMTDQQFVELPRFAKAISLALGLGRRPYDLDLRQGPLAAQQSYQFLRDKTPLLAGLAAAIFVSFGFSVFAEMRALDAERESLEARLEAATLANFGKKTSSVETATKMLDDAIKGKNEDPLPEMDAFDVMVELSKVIPEDVTHDISDFDYQREGKVQMKGVVDELEDVDRVVQALTDHRCFQNVNKARTSALQKENKQKYTLDFEVRCEPEKPKSKDDADADAATKSTASTKAKSAPTSQVRPKNPKINLPGGARPLRKVGERPKNPKDAEGEVGGPNKEEGGQ